MNKWLENFAYKSMLTWWIIPLAGLIAIFVAYRTVSINTWKVATRKLVDVLRDE